MRSFTLFAAGLCLLAVPAAADWDVNDPHKMHFPQLPDPNGYDVDIVQGNVVADDWQCSGSGPVSDIHFWYSWWQDRPCPIISVHASIHADIPDPDGEGPAFSMPGELLWSRDFYASAGQFTTRLAGQGEQRFIGMPNPPWPLPDHLLYYQCNIENIPEPFFQEEGTIYWLDLSTVINDPVQSHIGWKTSLDHWNDFGVFWGAAGWELIRDGDFNDTHDLAFVITPEPGALLLLALGAVLRRRR